MKSKRGAGAKYPGSFGRRRGWLWVAALLMAAWLAPAWAGSELFTVMSDSPWPGYAIPNGIWLTGDFRGNGRTDVFHAVANTDYANVWLSDGNGRFTVKSFSPWSGYAIPNGIWMVGDVNGDGKADIIHAVQGTDYVNVWLSNGDGTFTVKSFSPWPGYAIPNGIWMVADVNGDGKADIIHAVQGTDYANIWLSNGDGTFTVKSFSPWAGYAIPNGIWMAADVNGDGKADIIHAVQGTDYANIWLSKGDGTFTVKSFSPWAGYAIPNGVWMTADVNGDGKADIIHAVQGTDYANIWLSNGDGSFSVQSFSPWPGYAIPNGLWMTGDFLGNHKADIFHAVQDTDYANVWLSNFPAPGQFAIDAVEITQSVQDLSADVPLVGDKPTLARAYVSVNAANGAQVTGTTNLQPGGTAIVADSPLAVNPALNFQMAARRNSLANSLNFSLGAAPNGGSLSLTLPQLRDAVTGSPVACTNCGTTISEAVQASVPLRLQVVGLSYSTGNPPQTFAPTNLDFTLIQSWLGRAYPVAPTQIIYGTRTVASTNAWPFDCNAANAQVSTIRNNDINGGQDHRTHYIGLVADGGISQPNFMRGCASGIPGSADPSTVASVPTGPNTWGWDFDGSYGDWYSGHELGHTFGRFHPGFCNGNSKDDNNFPYPNGQIAHDDDDNVGYDNGDSTNGLARSALAGTATFDIMSYCSNLWLSAYAYSGIFARLQAEGQLAAGPAPGGGPLPARGAVPPRAPLAAVRSTLAGPNDLDHLVAAGGSHAPMLINRVSALEQAMTQRPLPILGRALAPAVIYASTTERRPEPVRGAAVQAIATRGAAAPADVLRQFAARPAQVAALEQPPMALAPEAAPAVRPAVGDFINIIATVNLSRRNGQIRFVNRLGRALVPASESPSQAALVFLDVNGRVVARHPVALRISTDLPPDADKTALVDAVVPVPQIVARFELRYEEALIDARNVPTHAPTIDGLGVAPPAASAHALTPDATHPLALTWRARHPDAVPMDYTVQISRDQGKTWETIAVGLDSPSHALSAVQSHGDRQFRVRVIANDGFHSVTSNALPVTLP